MLLDLTGLDKSERTMIQASIGNARDEDKIIEALLVQHPRIHLKGVTSSYGGGFKGRGSGKDFGGKGKRKGFQKWHRNPSGFAGAAVEDYDYDDTAYLAGNDEAD